MTTGNSKVGSENREPIAIVGIGCRFPGGANSPEAFWQLLSNGVDAIREVPADRWSLETYYDPEPGTPGKTNAREGGFVDGIDQFDAAFFGISPREAKGMDPQQRMLLEVAWEALEDAGQTAEKLRGSMASVYVGISSHDYSFLNVTGDVSMIDTYTNTGSAMSIAANRISFCFDFMGPSLAIDTACSSSLVGVDLACQSLWDNTSPVALAGGVNVLIKPEPFIGFSRLSMLSPDCRCKAFDASANGFVRSEGAAFVVLKRLSDAARDGDRIYALIRSSAVNQDGHTSGLTVPSFQAQEELVLEACRRAGIEPSSVQYVEAHGTGTLVGDPVEARALGSALSRGREAGDLCAVGSVKTNVGHLEPAAGIVGLIKVALSLKHEMVPPNLHYNSPNPDIDFDSLMLRVPTALEPWAEKNGKRLAGVNSFGFGGTNAHVILEGYSNGSNGEVHSANGNGKVAAVAGVASTENAAAQVETTARPVLLTLSARTAGALKSLAASYAKFLSPEGEGANVDFGDVCWSAAMRRSRHDHRLAIATADRAVAIEALEAFAAGKPHAALVSGKLVKERIPKLAFVFSGQGPQWWAMGRELIETEPVFREIVAECDRAMAAEGSGWSLMEELTAEEGKSRVDETQLAQPMIFAVQAALFKLWETWGVRPDAVVGHSVGEVAAAYACESLSLQDAARVIYHRGRCMSHAKSGGKMLVVGLPLEAAESLIEEHGDAVSMAAVNSPSSVTLSGDGTVLESIARHLESRDVFHKFLRVGYAFHSRDMEPAREGLAQALANLTAREASVPVYSTVEGAKVDGSGFGGDYWWHNVRKGVRFAPAIKTLIDDGYDTFVEIAPHPVLSGNTAECAQHSQTRVTTVTSLRRQEPELQTMFKAAGTLFVAGRDIDLAAFVPGDGQLVNLPQYTWEHEVYWYELPDAKLERTGPSPHPLLGRRQPGPTPIWRSPLDMRVARYLRDHQVQGHVLFSATSFVEMALAAADECFHTGQYLVEDVSFQKACFLQEPSRVLAQFVMDPETSSFSIFSSPEGETQTWTRHVTGEVRVQPTTNVPAPLDLDALRARLGMEVGSAECYARLASLGLEYGPTFQGIQHCWGGNSEALAEIVAPEGMGTLAPYQAHPAILDACMQALICGTMGSDAGGMQDSVYLPVEMRQVRTYGRLTERVWAYARLVGAEGGNLFADITVCDESGNRLVEIVGLRCQAVDRQQGSEDSDETRLAYGYRWQLQALPGSDRTYRSAAHLPSLDDVVASSSAETKVLLEELIANERLRTIATGVDSICAAFIVAAFRKLGYQFPVGDRFTTEEFSDRIAIADRYRRLMHRYLEILSEDGIFHYENGAWEVRTTPPDEDPLPAWQSLMINYPSFYAELTLTGRCGPQLAEILKGNVDPLHLIFPDGSLTVTEQLYQDSPALRFHNEIAQRAFKRMFENYPEDRPLRVLEIGAGTGGLTAFALPKLPADRTEYVFTDLSNHFFLKAQEKFADFPFVTYKRLDIENDPLQQEFEPHSFDVIIASQCLHATKDLRETLENTKKLLASHGVVVLLEAVGPTRWVDMVFSLTDGWWRFTDTDLRANYPLLTLEKWSKLFMDLGFTEVKEASGRAIQEIENAVVIARGPEFSKGSEPETTLSLAPAAADAAASEATETPVVPQAPVARKWLVLGDRRGIGARLATRLRAMGDECVEITNADTNRDIDSEHYEVVGSDIATVKDLCRRVLTSAGDFTGVVDFWNCDVPHVEQLDGVTYDGLLDVGCMSVVSLTQVLTEGSSDVVPQLWVVTSGAESVSKAVGERNPTQAVVWGLVRVVINEAPTLRARLADLGPEALDAEIDSLCAELRADLPEDEIAFRGDARFVHRWTRYAEFDQLNRVVDVKSGTAAFRLETSRAGTFDRLHLQEVDRDQLGPGQVEIRVEASGLNFSDVMKALGIYPGLPDGPVPFGIECSGTISAVGAGVEQFQVGDEVVALGGFTFGSHTRTDARFVAKKPSHCSFEDAATLPVAYLTAHYALNHVGRIRRGERVLIHAAAGGVGMAAIHLARLAGAEVFVTAGTRDKRDLLRSIGIEHIMDSRSLAFADEVYEITKGKGVDIVLNSLAGDALRKGLSILNDFGRFIEIGKRDIYGNSRIGLKPFRKNATFVAIDLDKAMHERPDEVAFVFQDVMRQLNEGLLPSLPYRTFPISGAINAFRYMAQAKHMGKVVITLRGDASRVTPKPLPQLKFDKDATYLVTGGLGGFGLIASQWLVENGARHLVLMGRSGAKTEQAQQAVAKMREAGAEVVVAQSDVSKREDVDRILAEIESTMPPLRGVFHVAMALNDCLLANLDAPTMKPAWAPKISGALNLHRATQGKDLDFLILFSSMGSVWGFGGQANYSSANVFLDALSYYRKSKGLPCASVSWGYLGQVGWVAERQELATRFESMGVSGFSPKNALALLGRFIQEQPPHVGVIQCDWTKFAGTYSPRFAHLGSASANTGGVESSKSGAAIRAALLAADPSARAEMLETVLCEQIARLLGSTPDKISLDKPLNEIGLDSLIAVELRNWIEGDLRLSVPIVELMKGPTISKLANLLVAQLVKPGAAKAAAAATPSESGQPADGTAVPAAAASTVEAGHTGNGDHKAHDVKLPAGLDLSTNAGDISKMFSAFGQGSGLDQLQAFQSIDLSREATLDESIVVDMTTATATAPKNALLTGATGYVGSHLLAELLARTDLNVTCVVRADNAEAGLQRISEKLEALGVSTDSAARRIQVVPGDLAKPRFGLSEARFDELAHAIDVIYHAGAEVKSVAAYETVRDANVGGTHEIVRLACRNRVKPLHHISTLAVFSNADHLELKVPCETDIPRRHEALVAGYPQSKWVAEQLVLQAQQRGLQATIYRLGSVTGHSKTGLSPLTDAIFRELLASVQLGAIAEKDCPIEMTPVDYVSEAVVSLSQRVESRGRVFHLVNESVIPWNDLADWMRKYGFAVEKVPHGEWRQRLLQHPQLASTHVEQLTSQLAALSSDAQEVRFDSSEAAAALAEQGIVCPPVDDGLLKTYFQFAVESGSISAPNGPGSPSQRRRPTAIGGDA